MAAQEDQIPVFGRDRPRPTLVRRLAVAVMDYFNPARPVLHMVDQFFGLLSMAREQKRTAGLVPWSSIGWRRFTSEEWRLVRWAAGGMAVFMGGVCALLIYMNTFHLIPMAASVPGLWLMVGLSVAVFPGCVYMCVLGLDGFVRPRKQRYVGIRRLRRLAARNRLRARREGAAPADESPRR